jgi:hypothetical protein
MNINISLAESSVLFEYICNDLSFTHLLEFPSDITPSDDSLALISIFSRPANANFYKLNGVKVFDDTKQFIENSLKSRLDIALKSGNYHSNALSKTVPEKSFLAFSGGFDSIAARFLLGEYFPLASVDFGGNFSREFNFFKKFNPYIFRWNIRNRCPENSLKFNESIDWRFLIAPLLCFSSRNETIGISTGTIMEASPFWFNGALRANFKNYYSTFGPGSILFNPIGALTEYLTTFLAVKSLGREMLLESLDSLAGLNSFKRYRKQVLIAAVENTNPPLKPQSTPIHRFGSSFGDDMVALYVAWKYGEKWVQENYCENIPLSNGLDMAFFEKINNENIKTLDPQLSTNILSKLYDFGISHDDNDDLNNINKALDFRNNFCNSIRERKDLTEKPLLNKKTAVEMSDIVCVSPDIDTMERNQIVEMPDMAYVSLGENALADNILKRHGLKSFSTPYSDSRSNIDYAILLESIDYKGLLERKNLRYDYVWNKKVVKSTIINDNDDIYEESYMNGFEFTNDDVIGLDKDRDNFNAKIQQLLELRGKQVVFFYHHRVNKNSNLESIFEKARKFLEFYSQKEQAFMVIFTQKIIKNKSERKLTYRKVNNTIHFFEFCTEQVWGGNNPDVFWARVDDDLVKEMIQSSVGIVQSKFAK